MKTPGGGVKHGGLIAIAVAGLVVGVPVGWEAKEALYGSSTAGSSPVRVVACTPGKTVTMTLRVTNSGPAPQAYNLTLYWFDGTKPFLTTERITDAIPAGQTVTIPEGNLSDSVDWKPGLTCAVKVDSAV